MFFYSTRENGCRCETRNPDNGEVIELIENAQVLAVTMTNANTVRICSISVFIHLFIHLNISHNIYLSVYPSVYPFKYRS